MTIIMKMIKKDWDIKQKVNIETYLKKKKQKREYGKSRYHSMSEEKKQKLKEYQKKNIKWQKSLNIVMNKIVF